MDNENKAARGKKSRKPASNRLSGRREVADRPVLAEGAGASLTGRRANVRSKNVQSEPPPDEDQGLDLELESESPEPLVFEAEDGPVVRSTPRCPYCGGYWPFEDEYCPECGMSMGDGVPSESE
jgi:hypothetical protein